jgi:hypothetical protein
MNVPGGGMVAMNTAAAINQTANRQQADQEQERRLNTYIFDYLCNKNLYDLARNFSLQCPINPAGSKPRHQGVNGADDSMDTDSKEDVKRPTDLPYPNIPHHPSENAFLYDWWVQFWDIFGAARRAGTPNPNTESYLHHNMVRAFFCREDSGIRD